MDFKVKAISRDEFDALGCRYAKLLKNLKQATTASAQQGQEIFNKSCIGCHAVTPSNATPEAASLAPNLATFGDRDTIAGVLEHNEENLKKWIQDPETYKPGNKMTGNYGEII